MNSTLRNIEHQPETVRPVLLLVAQVAATQPQLSTLPDKALKVGMHLGTCVHAHVHVREKVSQHTHLSCVLCAVPAPSVAWAQCAAVLAMAGWCGRGLQWPEARC